MAGYLSPEVVSFPQIALLLLSHSVYEIKLSTNK